MRAVTAGIAIRIFVMCLILGLMKVQLDTLFTAIVTASSGSDYVTLVGVLFNTFICMVINSFIVLKVPAMAGAMLTGQVSGGLGDFVQGAAMVMSGASMVKAFSNNTSHMASSLAQNALGAGNNAVPAGNNILNTATTSATTAAKAAGESGGKAAAMIQNVGGTSTPLETTGTTASVSPSAKLDALSNATVNNSQTISTGGTTSTPNHSTNSNTKSSDNNVPLGGSNGISGANSGLIPQTKLTGAKINEAGKHFGKLGEQAARMSGSGHSGASELNINPHRE